MKMIFDTFFWFYAVDYKCVIGYFLGEGTVNRSFTKKNSGKIIVPIVHNFAS